MMNCCDDKGSDLLALGQRQARVLKIVLAVNAVMFLVEAAAGILGHSSALLGDSLDMLEDATIYAVSLYVIGRGEKWKNRAAALKGFIMLTLGAGILVQAVLKAMSPALPAAGTMGTIGLIALAANGLCFWLLYRHRGDDLNMRSTWLCSRNDIFSNLGVLGAAVLVAATGSKWPDILVGALIALIFLGSALGVLREALGEIRKES